MESQGICIILPTEGTELYSVKVVVLKCAEEFYGYHYARKSECKYIASAKTVSNTE